MKWLPACAFLFFALAAPASGTVLATCGPSSGQAYFLGGNPGWQPDKISSGQLIFTMDDKDKPNLLFRDARGNLIDAASDGAEIAFTRIAPPEFSILVAYPGTGVTESYNLVVDGKRKMLLWTSSKARAGGFLTKVGAYTAECD